MGVENGDTGEELMKKTGKKPTRVPISVALLGTLALLLLLRTPSVGFLVALADALFITGVAALSVYLFGVIVGGGQLDVFFFAARAVGQRLIGGKVGSFFDYKRGKAKRPKPPLYLLVTGLALILLSALATAVI
ncbi:MAG: DUF3899 domain-containing protein [Clostridia bacterium]|nr:DUF3899 domain-containing protein [Clostridia bacterium]